MNIIETQNLTKTYGDFTAVIPSESPIFAKEAFIGF